MHPQNLTQNNYTSNKYFFFAGRTKKTQKKRNKKKSQDKFDQIKEKIKLKVIACIAKSI